MEVGNRVEYTGTQSPHLLGELGSIIHVHEETYRVAWDNGRCNAVYKTNVGPAPRRIPATLAEAVGLKPQGHFDPVPPTDPTKMQVGGDHYTKLKIQPMAYCMANGFDALQFTVIKYVSRFRSKNGIEDLKKARHAIDMLIAHEEKNGN